MSYEKVDDIENRLKRGAKKVAVGGLLMLSGYFAKDISTHETYGQLDNGHYGYTTHINGAGKTVATLGTAAFIALGASGRKKIMNFTKQIFAAENSGR